MDYHKDHLLSYSFAVARSCVHSLLHLKPISPLSSSRFMCQLRHFAKQETRQLRHLCDHFLDRTAVSRITDPIFLEPHLRFKLPSPNVGMLMQIGEQTSLGLRLESLLLDIYASETTTQDTSCTIKLTFSAYVNAKFHPYLSVDPDAAATAQSSVGIALGRRAVNCVCV